MSVISIKTKHQKVVNRRSIKLLAIIKFYGSGTDITFNFLNHNLRNEENKRFQKYFFEFILLWRNTNTNLYNDIQI